jgi:hypothetical protein
MLVAAADRARLVILQLRAQLFDTGTARQTLALQQFAGDVEVCSATLRSALALTRPGSGVPFLLRGELALLQLGTAFVQVLLAGPQARKVFDGAVACGCPATGCPNADLLGDASVRRRPP